MDTQELVKAVRQRSYQSPHGISFAKTYLGVLDGCFTGGLCPEKFFAEATPEKWLQIIKESESKLVYHHPNMVVKKYTERCPEGYCLVFDNVLTSVTRDRDGDILESKGANVDPKMPLLWQHLPVYPIGKLLSVVSQNKNRVITRFGIADTELGRDAAKMVKLDILRISHGFKPKRWEEIIEKGEDGKDYPTGYRIFEFDVMEGSLVSVPSNTDATILAHSEEKLHHPLMKQFVKSYYDARPTVIRGGIGPDGRGKTMDAITIPVRIELTGLEEINKTLSLTPREMDFQHTDGCACGGKTFDADQKHPNDFESMEDFLSSTEVWVYDAS